MRIPAVAPITPQLLAVEDAAKFLGMGETLFRAEVLPKVPQVQVGPVTLLRTSDLVAATSKAPLRTAKDLSRAAELHARCHAEYSAGRYPKDDRGTVYFLQCPAANGAIKIGVTLKLAARLRSLEDTIPCALRLLATVAGGRALEAQLHELFADHRLRGEWFSPSAALMALVAALRKANAESES